MPQINSNPDRDFAADYTDGSEEEDLRDLLKYSQPADIFDIIIQRRIGELISRAVFDPKKQHW